MLDQIKDVVHYALKMLNDILDVSKMNSGVFRRTASLSTYKTQ
jgi:hypothetical protein